MFGQSQSWMGVRRIFICFDCYFLNRLKSFLKCFKNSLISQSSMLDVVIQLLLWQGYNRSMGRKIKWDLVVLAFATAPHISPYYLNVAELELFQFLLPYPQQPNQRANEDRYVQGHVPVCVMLSK